MKPITLASAVYGKYQGGAYNKYMRQYNTQSRPVKVQWVKPKGGGTVKASLQPLPKNRPVYLLKNGKRRKTLKKQVKELSKKVKADQAYHTYKFCTATNFTTGDGEVDHKLVGGQNVGTLESAVANLRYYDPSNPGTLVTADASTGTYSRDIHFQSVTSKVSMRNNYQVPCKLKVYLVKPKQDTSISPLTYYSDGIADQVISGVSNQSQLYLTDIDLFNEAYSCKLLLSCTLEPGRERSVSHTVKDIDYDPSMYDTHNLTYQKKYKNFQFIIRMEGVTGHDTTLSEYGIMPAGIDIQINTVYKMVYDAGVNLNDISYSDTRTTPFTNAGLVSNKPVSDNQQYSST